MSDTTRFLFLFAVFVLGMAVFPVNVIVGVPIVVSWLILDKRGEGR